MPVGIHRVVSFQKFGMASMAIAIQTRHLNGRALDNHWGNIGIGDAQANSMDRLPTNRKSHSTHAASFRRRLSGEQARDLLRCRSMGAKYAELCKRYNISKSTVSGIGNGPIYPELDELRQELNITP